MSADLDRLQAEADRLKAEFGGSALVLMVERFEALSKRYALLEAALADQPPAPQPCDEDALCSADKCDAHCGYAHLRGCDAVKEYLRENPQCACPCAACAEKDRALELLARACDSLAMATPDRVLRKVTQDAARKARAALAAGKDAPKPKPTLNREQAMRLAERVRDEAFACVSDQGRVLNLLALVDEALAGKDGGR